VRIGVRALLVIVAILASVANTPAQEPAPMSDSLHKPFDEILDTYVRDGYVYYNALRIERGKLDRYVASLEGTTAETINKWAPSRQLAFWINTYNALVLQTVIDHFPIRGKSADFPANSIRQIPGAFERHTFHAGGKTFTLDSLEKDVIAPFGDARAVLALGRGAVSSGRLKSEAYSADRIDRQLDEVTRELVTRYQLIKVDIPNNELSVSALFSWREAAFTAAWASRANPLFATRSPLERAVLAMIDPLLVPNEQSFLSKNQFKMTFQNFDWTLNDLSGRK
jgi:hypothetical protein